MSARTMVLLWAQRVVSREQASPQQVLELAPDAEYEAAQEAFHKLARFAHPDLHRTTLTADELELVTSAYGRAAAAYQELRRQRLPTTRIRPTSVPPGGPGHPITEVIPTSPMSGKAVSVPETSEARLARPTGPPAMSSRALVHYRKAEASLRRGELTGAILQLKMAVAADPQSGFLRTALTEVESEITKKRDT